MKKRTMLLVLGAFASAPVASAQSPALTHSTSHPAVAPAPAPALDDPTIVAIFEAANTWDIRTGQLAAKKSKNKSVRRFAAMMVHDHTAVRKLGRDLAKKLHVTPTPPGEDFALRQDHNDAMETLRATKGREFDRAYIDHEVKYHQAVIDAVTTQLLPATKNEELKALQLKVAPNFQAHLAMAKDVQTKLPK